MTHRFRGNPKGPDQEVTLYEEAAALLEERGVDVLRVNSSALTPSAVADRIAEAILHRQIRSFPHQPSPPHYRFRWLRNGASGLRDRHDFPPLLTMIRG
ncbi:hypothetical protein ACWGIG_38290, partial [Streptomyces sp. NPDC054863]